MRKSTSVHSNIGKFLNDSVSIGKVPNNKLTNAKIPTPTNGRSPSPLQFPLKKSATITPFPKNL